MDLRLLESLSNENLLKIISSIKDILRIRPGTEKYVAINECYGYFELSKEGLELYQKLSGESKIRNKIDDFDREDPYLIEVIDRLGCKANGEYADLVVEKFSLSPGQSYRIDNYDGKESISIKF